MVFRTTSLRSPAVREYLKTQIGEQALMVAFLCSSRPISAERISQKTGMKVSEARAALQALHTHSFVQCSKRMDKKTNWISYTWSLNLKKILDMVNGVYSQKLNLVQSTIEMEKNSLFFACSDRCRRMTLEEAMEVDFRCPACSLELSSVDNSDNVEKLMKLKCTLLALSA